MKRTTKLHVKDVILIVLICAFALLIPALLCFYATQANKYSALSKEVVSMEKEQRELIEENKKLVSEIAELSSAVRIEKIATEELGMHKAETEDIIRVEMTGDKNE